MKLAAALLLICASGFAQPASVDSKLSATLNAISKLSQRGPAGLSQTLSSELSREMLLIAPQDRRPASGTTLGFTNEFVAAMAGKDLTSMQRQMLQAAIANMMSGSGTNLRPAGQLRETMTAAGVDGLMVKRIVTDFIALGEELRGPDDLHILPVLAK